MSLEVAIQNLADAINALAATRIPTSGVNKVVYITGSPEPAVHIGLSTPDEAEQPKRGRGRPRKTAEPTASSDEFPAEVEVPVAPPKAAEPPAPQPRPRPRPPPWWMPPRSATR
jgi:hypothetical protein